MTVYIDASVLVAAVVPEPKTGIAKLLLRNAARLLASEWALTELASGLAIKVRTKQIGRADQVLALATARNLVWNSFQLVPVTSGDCRASTSYIERSSLPLRGGDALHLAIAHSAGATLWTLDRRMAEAGQALGFDARLLAP